MSLVIPSPRRLRVEDMACIHPNAAGMDIGARAIVVAVSPERDTEPVRVCATFTPALHALVDWLLPCGIDTVAMESTGVYWVPVFELAEQHGIHPSLVHARHVKTVPGRKSDWNDAQWRQTLHALGLLQGSLRPDAAICILAYPPTTPGGMDCPPCPPHLPYAKGAEAHEPPGERSAHGHHRGHRPGHPAGHRAWRA